MFQVGDVVGKPSLGICKIGAIRRVEIEGNTEEYYVIQSGEVDVLVPRRHAENGALRPPMNEKLQARVHKDLEAPFRPINIRPKDPLPEVYQCSPAQGKAILKRRDPLELTGLIRTLHNKGQDFVLDKKETDWMSTAMSMLVEEFAYLEKTTKARVKTRLGKLLSAGRKEGRRQAAAEDL